MTTLKVTPVVAHQSDAGGIVIELPGEGHFIKVAEVTLTGEDGKTERKDLFVALQDRHNKIHLAS
jgi:hypothetical protein